MKNLQTLKREAATAARCRGHRLTWALHHGESRSIYTGTCRYCDAWVQVKTKPEPNDSELGGPAVAVNCSVR